jgi:hypothetical protein
MKRYDVTTVDDGLDLEKADWLRDHLGGEQYRITNDGFLIDNYTVEFTDPRAETMYLLRWSS